MSKPTDDQVVQNAVLVNDNVKDSESDGTSILLNLEQMIKNSIVRIDKLKTESKLNKEMLADIFKNDPVYKEHDEQVKTATKTRTATKQQLLKQPQAAQLNSKVKEGSAEIKELSDALSEYLREYGRMSGTNEIETDDGEVREIVYTAKLVKKSSRF